MTTQFLRHLSRWSGCTNCGLSEHRHKICFYRGTIPCNVLFVGEAPGPTEDAFGSPFTGTSGHILQSVIVETLDVLDDLDEEGFSYGITNVVCCYPTSDGTTFRQPREPEIKACNSRLREIIRLAEPQRLVAVGSVATDVLMSMDISTPITHLKHPSFIQREEDKQKAILIYKEQVTELLHSLIGDSK